MQLYLVRHAEAVAAGEDGATTDASRHLTPKGLRQAARAASFLKEHGERPNAIVSSPLLRAVQTAEQIATHLAPEVKVAVIDELAPGHTQGSLVKALARHRCGSLVAVGHMPDMSSLAGLLATGTASDFLDFGKAAIAALEINGSPKPGAAKLLWFVRPRLMG
jgi:phosphohistidine phosphatase